MSKFRRTAGDLFTEDEHAILSEWFERRPPAVAEDILPDEAISRLGFDKAADLYRRIDAAVAFIVLERAERRPPQWSAIRDEQVNLRKRTGRNSRRLPSGTTHPPTRCTAKRRRAIRHIGAEHCLIRRSPRRQMRLRVCSDEGRRRR